jgi:hypothetical protein
MLYLPWLYLLLFLLFSALADITQHPLWKRNHTPSGNSSVAFVGNIVIDNRSVYEKVHLNNNAKVKITGRRIIMPLQNRFIFRLGFILTVIFISLILANLRWSFFGDATQVVRESDPDDYDWEAATPVDATDIRKLAERGVAPAQCNLGYIYNNGEGVPQDYKEAVRWFRKAAEQGYAEAQDMLGLMYYMGHGVPRDYKEAARWYRKAAEQGYALAQLMLGSWYYRGQGVPQDYKEAAMWYRKAAEQGATPAQCKLGYMYNNGEGVPRDNKEAVRWYRKAAEQGVAKAQFLLGLMYYRGQGVPQNHKEAVKWYRKAAERGLVKAQCELGLMYRRGQGVPQDDIRTYAWFNLAASQGDTDAAWFRNVLANFMTPQQIAAAQELTVELQNKIENRSSAATSETEK